MIRFRDNLRWLFRRSEHKQPLPVGMSIGQVKDWLDLHTPGRWRYHDPYKTRSTDILGWSEQAKSRVLFFKHEADLVLFRLAFSEELAAKSTPKIILPIIRRVMPNILASEIIGVQPMTGPTAQVFTMKARYATLLDETREELRESQMPWWRRWPARLRRNTHQIMHRLFGRRDRNMLG